MKERRGHPRAPIELQVDYKKLNSFFADYTKNISKGGTFIKTPKPLPVGTRFLFRLVVPGRPEAYELSGVVMHADAHGDQPGMGIQFTFGDEEKRRSFEASVEDLMTESLGPVVAKKLRGDG